jgi:tetratricopeptide (TPR) repeat protein
MRRFRVLALAGLLPLLLTAGAYANNFLVLPFENQTKNASLEWIGESLVESLSDRLVGPNCYVATREERMAAFDRLGIPAATIISHATMIKLADTMDADYVITGQYSLPSTGQLRVQAQVIELRPFNLNSRFSEEGALGDLLDIQDRLALSVARSYIQGPGGLSLLPVPVTQIRLDAWENYIRGLIAPTQQARIKFFRDAVRLEPGFCRPSLQLGKIYFQNRDYSTAVLWLSKLKREEPNYLEARFLLGLCYFLLEDYDKSEAAFQVVVSELPLNEVVNNMAAAESRKNRKVALDNFRKAADGDPNDPDYQFNLGYWYWKSGQYAPAAQRLRAAVERRPEDAEAHALLARVLERAGNPAEAAKERAALARNPAAMRYDNADDSVFVDLERIKRNYDENSFRQLRMALQSLTEESLSRLPPAKHAEVHLDRGRELFREQNDAEALIELKEAAALNDSQPETHLLLARLQERNGRYEEAIHEAERSIVFHDSIDARLLLAKIYLQQNKLLEAQREARMALEIEPANVAAQSVLKTVEIRSKL